MNEVEIFRECITNIEMWVLTFSIFSFLGSCVALYVVWKNNEEDRVSKKKKAKKKVLD